MNTGINLRGYGVKQARKHELLFGKKPLGRGAFSAVFEGTKPGRVLKLTVDHLSYYMLNDCVVAVKHRHFPKVYNNYGIIGETSVGFSQLPIYLYEIERLNAIPRGGELRALVNKIDRLSRFAWSPKVDPNDVAMRALSVMSKNSDLPRSIRNALDRLSMFCSNIGGGMTLDMHSKNFMARNNGELVITDPIADMSLLW